MTATAPHPGEAFPAPAFAVVRVDESRLGMAAQRLVAASASADPGAGERFLAAARQHGIDLRAFWVSLDVPSGRVRQTCLAVPGAGKTAMFFTSRPRSASESKELAAVIEAACRDVSPVVRLAQALLTPGEGEAQVAFEAAGFVKLASLAYLHRPRPRPHEFAPFQSPQWQPGMTVRNVEPGEDAALLEALERTYEDTLDCPALCGLREIHDVLESHRATGRHDPKLWWMVWFESRPLGAMLFNPCPDQGTIELVYLGLSPELRGKGIASRLLGFGLHRLSNRREPEVTCAVDLQNQPALRLYSRHGFTTSVQRLALVRPLSPGA